MKTNNDFYLQMSKKEARAVLIAILGNIIVLAGFALMLNTLIHPSISWALSGNVAL